MASRNYTSCDIETGFHLHDRRNLNYSITPNNFIGVTEDKVKLSTQNLNNSYKIDIESNEKIYLHTSLSQKDNQIEYFVKNFFQTIIVLIHESQNGI